jgi:hypothetical protein
VYFLARSFGGGGARFGVAGRVVIRLGEKAIHVARTGVLDGRPP